MEDANNNFKITKKVISILALTIVIVSFSIFYAANYFNKGKERPGGQSSVLKDRDGNIYILKLMSDGKVWMTENLSIYIPESYCQEDDTLNCTQYGRLYTWEAAMKGCKKLGDGWRLPTNEEWQAMAKSYDGVVDDSDDKGKSAYESLIEDGNAEFNALLGGNREANGNYERLGDHGFYWTATEYDSTEAWFYNFAKGATLLNHHTGTKKRAVSVRCIKEMEILGENKRQGAPRTNHKISSSFHNSHVNP